MSIQKNVRTANYSGIYLFALSLIMVFPNIGFIILLLCVFTLGIRTKLMLDLFVMFAIMFFALILANKNIFGDGNDYVTYYDNLVSGMYPKMTDNFFDFLFWKIAAIILSFLPDKDPFQLFLIINILSFTPYYFIFKLITDKLDANASSKIIAVYFIMTLSSLSFWNLYGNYIRQAWAFTFFLLALIYLNEKKILKFSSLAIISIISHSSGCVFIGFLIIAYGMRKINLNKISWFIMLCATFSLLVSLLIPPLSLITNILPAHIASKIAFYENWSGSDFGRVAVIRLYLLILIAFILDKIVEMRLHKIYGIYCLLFISSYVFVLASSMISGVSKIVERLYYPSILLIFLVISIQIYFIRVSKINTKWHALILFIVVFSLTFLLPYSLYSSLYYNPYFYNGHMYDFLFSNLWQ